MVQREDREHHLQVKKWGTWNLFDARSEAWNRFSLTALKREPTSWHLLFRLLASRTVRQYIFTVLSHPLFGTLLWQPQEMNTVLTPPQPPPKPQNFEWACQPPGLLLPYLSKSSLGIDDVRTFRPWHLMINTSKSVLHFQQNNNCYIS